jgi:hypothetical protein
MHLEIAGKDRGGDIGRELLEEAGQRTDAALSARIARERPVLDLKSASCTESYQDCQVELMRARNCVDPSGFDTPAGRGPAGRLRHLFRRLVWRLLRYQYDWLTFEQNTINVQLTYELEFERDLRRKQTSELSARIRRLESIPDRSRESQEGDGDGNPAS